LILSRTCIKSAWWLGMSKASKEEKEAARDEDYVEPGVDRKRSGGRATGAKNYTTRETTSQWI